MPSLESIATGLIIFLAGAYLTRRWYRHAARNRKACGCGDAGCKVPSPKVR